MAHPSDVVVGLDVDAFEIRAAGFDLAGRELAFVRRPVPLLRSAGGAVELDPARLWQTMVRAVRQLADRIPDLGRRTVAIGLTGALGGLCLVDEDGDPLSPAISPLDRRALARTGTGGAGPLGERLLDARIGWVAEHEPSLLDQAADALTPKDWVLFCLTGERFAEAIEADLTFAGDAANRLARDGLGAHIALPAPPAPPNGALRLDAAASAVTGWWEGTPVVAAPPGPLAAALALGAASFPESVALSILDHDAWHGGVDPLPGADGLAMPVDHGVVRLRRGRVGGEAVAWLGAQIDALLADAGLIGQSGEELRAIIDDRAGAACPGRVRFEVGAAGWSVAGIDRDTGLPDLLRAIHEAIGAAAAEALAGRRAGPEAAVVAGDLAASPTLRRILGARLGVPLRRLVRVAPVATGAAMAAATASGAIPSLAAAAASWVEPHLSPEEAPDPELVEAYASRRPPLPGAGPHTGAAKV